MIWLVALLPPHETVKGQVPVTGLPTTLQVQLTLPLASDLAGPSWGADG